MSKKLLTQECQNCLIMIKGDTPQTGPYILCRYCSEKYIAQLPVNADFPKE